MASDDITPLVLTFNEAANLQRSIEMLRWAREVLVVDSYSTDDTVAIARSFSNVRLVQRTFDTFADQCNFGVSMIRTSWVLSLDADYVLSDHLVAEMSSLVLDGSVSGYRTSFVYCVGGKPLRASLYPPRTILYRRDRARYRNDGHGHRVHVDGRIGVLGGVVYHDDRKSLGRWLEDQRRYADQEVRKLARDAVVSWPDKVRRNVVLAPPLVFLYLLFIRRLVLDGWPGWVYVCQRTIAELLLSLRLAESRWTGQDRPSS